MLDAANSLNGPVIAARMPSCCGFGRAAAMNRNCGACTLCCKLVPVEEIRKPAGKRCVHQRHTGCQVYRREGFPDSCALWSCRWLVRDDTSDLRRPDLSHYVIDVMPDTVWGKPNGSDDEIALDAIQVWIDPKYPEAHRDPALREFISRRAKEGLITIVRYSATDAFCIIAPPLSVDWIETPRQEATRTTPHKDRLVAMLEG